MIIFLFALDQKKADPDLWKSIAMEIRKFRPEYNLELIPASHEGIFLGGLVWDPILGPP
jgi:hypothetical protein